LEKKKSDLLKETQGYTLVELITVLAIVAIMGTMLVSMLNLGVRFYRTENTAMDNQNNARLAMAYITVKIRQNDVDNGITVESETVSLDDSIEVLRIKDTSYVSGTKYFWIYYDDNTDKLREQHSLSFNQELDSGAEIADLESVTIEQLGANIIRLEVESMDGSVNLVQEIFLRSTPGFL